MDYFDRLMILLIRDCVSLLYCMPGNPQLDARNSDFYIVGWWIIFVLINLLEFVLGYYLGIICFSWVLLLWYIWYTCSNLGWIIPHYWEKPSWVLKPNAQKLWFLSVRLGEDAVFPTLGECWTFFSNLFRLFFPLATMFLHLNVLISTLLNIREVVLCRSLGCSLCWLFLCYSVLWIPTWWSNSQRHLFHSEFCSLHHSLETLKTSSWDNLWVTSFVSYLSWITILC